MPESSFAAICIRQFFCPYQLRTDNWRDDELSDTHVRLDLECGVAVVDKDRQDFPAVISVDRSWRVQYRDAALPCQSRSRPDLGLETFRQLNTDAGRAGIAHTWLQIDFVRDSGVKVEPGSAGRGVLWDGCLGVNFQYIYLHDALAMRRPWATVWPPVLGLLSGAFPLSWFD